jgi:hypothetical protein
MVVIGSILVLTNNSYAAREKRNRYQDRGGHYQKWHKPAYDKHGPAWRHHLKRHPYRPADGIRHKQYRWYLRPIYRHGHPGRFHQTVVREINNYYSSTESYAEPEDEFSASASISDTGFSITVGVKHTD